MLVAHCLPKRLQRLAVQRTRRLGTARVQVDSGQIRCGDQSQQIVRAVELVLRVQDLLTERFCLRIPMPIPTMRLSQLLLFEYVVFLIVLYNIALVILQSRQILFRD